MFLSYLHAIAQVSADKDNVTSEHKLFVQGVQAFWTSRPKVLYGSSKAVGLTELEDDATAIAFLLLSYRT